MFPPCEMMAKFFLPAVRGIVVHRLRRKGVGQPTIARLVGTTQPAVSQILAKGEDKYFRVLENMGVERGEALMLVDTLVDVLHESPAHAAGMLYSYWRSLLSEGRLCAFHRSIYPQLADCEICMSLDADAMVDGDRMNVLRKLEGAVKRLEESPGIYRLIPEVGSNLVYSLKNAVSINEVAGVAGRIVSVNKRVKSVGRPTMGGSKHLASVLLRAREVDPSIRSAINIKHSPEVEEALKSLGVQAVSVGPRARPLTEQDILDDVKRCLEGGECRAVLHGGGVGYEPITYIFGKTPEEVVEIVLKLVGRVVQP
ncbi:MAG: thiamine-phosphate synthase family protein [Candidatus Caldarchaeum sp.]